MNAATLIENSPGMTYRQLDSWCNQGIFGHRNVRCGTGRHRHFTEPDLLVAQTLGRLTADMTAMFGARYGSWDLYRVVADQVRAGAEQIHIEYPNGLVLTMAVLVPEPIGA